MVAMETHVLLWQYICFHDNKQTIPPLYQVGIIGEQPRSSCNIPPFYQGGKITFVPCEIFYHHFLNMGKEHFIPVFSAISQHFPTLVKCTLYAVPSMLLHLCSHTAGAQIAESIPTLVRAIWCNTTSRVWDTAFLKESSTGHQNEN